MKRLLTRPDGETLTLPRSDYRVLRELLEANNRVVSRDQLTRSAFGRDHLPDDRSVDMCVSRLRQHPAPRAGGCRANSHHPQRRLFAEHRRQRGRYLTCVGCAGCGHARCSASCC
ncbi:two component transcriptional regulator [Pseudomonas putida S11]|nr:two component transcriptional regulator [Pseudomonas putida S11]